jgi:deoxyribodipyrimidine photo-lyase
MTFDIGIFIFRKDLRTYDNRGLNKLAKECKEILPVFIFDIYQVDLNNNNKNYLSFPALRFLCEAVEDLYNNIKNEFKSKLYIFYGDPDFVIKYIFDYILKSNKTIALGFNTDFTQYSIKRDSQIIDLCKKNNVDTFINDDDYTMCSMDKLVKNDSTAYKQYGAFRKNMLANKKDFNKPESIKINFVKKDIKFKNLFEPKELAEFWDEHLKSDYTPLEVGKREIALNTLKNLKQYSDYNVKRDTLSYQTTHLSAYLNFGLISEREFYYALLEKLGSNTQLINQVVWRDYYLCLLRFLPDANSYINHVDDRYNKLGWTDKKPAKSSKVWKEWETMMNSKTGFLLVDAAIQEIKKTGFMHNRCRMIVGVFSVKYLLINPLCRYVGLNDWFSRHLLDCSTSQNKLNAQWVTELDFPGKKFSPSEAPIAGRPMSISNTMIKKWDPDCAYIKKWLPHLANVDNKVLIGWDTKYDLNIHPKPMFDAKDRYNEWITLCKKVK